jgi:alpha-beta hydrolase superfamily lysophospholipase
VPRVNAEDRSSIRSTGEDWRGPGAAAIEVFPHSTQRARTVHGLTDMAEVCRWRSIRVASSHRAIPFFQLAQKDRIIDNVGTRAIASRFQGETSMIEYPNAHHTLEFEPDTQPWLSDVTRWIEKQIE